jgi:tetratricopeptide (TPR) repeat protein
MYIDILEQTKGTLQIILYLYENEKTEISYIARDNNIPRQTCYTALEGLEEMGIIVTMRERGWPPRVYCQLTERGNEIATKLSEVDTRLQSTIEGYKRQLSELKKSSKSKKAFELESLPLLKKLERECFNCGRWDEALEYGNKIIALSQKYRDYSGLAEALRNIGTINERRQKFDKSLDFFQKSIKAARKADDLHGLASDYYNIGAIFERRGDYEKALGSYKTAEGYAEKSRSEIDMGRVYLGTGRILAKKGLYRESIKSMKRSINLFEKNGTTDELPKAYTSLGSTEFYLNVNNAIKWHEKCIDISEKIGNMRGLGYGLSNAAGCYIKKGDYKKAAKYLDRALPIFKQLKEKVMVSNVLTNYARIHRHKRQWRDAREYLQKAMNIARVIGVPAQTADVSFQYGLLYKDRGNEVKAKRYLKRALETHKKMGSKEMVERVETELKGLSK